MIHGIQNQKEPRQRRRSTNVDRMTIKDKSNDKVDVNRSAFVKQNKKQASNTRVLGKHVPSVSKTSEHEINSVQNVGHDVKRKPDVTPSKVNIVQEEEAQFVVWKRACPLSHVKLSSQLSKLSITDDFHDLDDDIAFNQDVMQMFSEDDRGDLVPSILRECTFQNEEVVEQPTPVIETEIPETVEVTTIADETEDNEFSMI